MEMSVLRCVAFLFLIPLFGNGQAPQQHHRADLSSQAELPVRRLYQQLVSRPIGGIPTIERMKSLSPYLSDSLLNRITQARACGDDWFRLHPQNDIKAPLAVGIRPFFGCRRPIRSPNVSDRESEITGGQLHPSECTTYGGNSP